MPKKSAVESVCPYPSGRRKSEGSLWKIACPVSRRVVAFFGMRGFLIGPMWNLTTLVGREYCVSEPFYATKKEDLQRLAFALRALKGLILNR